MKKKIAVLSGDGIGPEIIKQALLVVDAINAKFNHQFEFLHALVGAIAIDATGNPFPEETAQICLHSDAILFGAIGDPKYDNNPKAAVRPEQGLLAMRKRLGLFANIRPVFTYESLIDKSPLKRERIEGADFVVIRELTGGIYFGEPRGRTENLQKAFDTCVYSKEEIIRVSKVAFELAQKRRKKLTAVDKANVLVTSRLWRETIQEMKHEYPDVELDFLFVDNAAMQIITNPKTFDVIVTENMFGDILTDEASVIAGSLGLLPSASTGFQTSLYEPIHGSYPQAAGKNIANPLATILSAAMMYEMSFQLIAEGALIRKAVEESIKAGIVTVDLNATKSYSTSEVGAWVVDYIKKS